MISSSVALIALTSVVALNVALDLLLELLESLHSLVLGIFLHPSYFYLLTYLN